MNSKNLGRIARIALAAAALMGAQFASAQVAAGSVIRLSDGTGSLAGVYNGSVISGPGAASGSFQTFCLEKFEYFGSHTQDLYVKSVSTATQNATGGPSTATKVSGGAAGSDSLSAQTAYLFTQFYSNQATYAGSLSLANSMQRAVWFLEGELAGSDLTAYNADTKAKEWVSAANTAVSNGLWSGLGNVRVLNLYTNASYTSHSQDQLYMVTAVPEPQTYALMLAGLGLIGTIARRRKSKAA